MQIQENNMVSDPSDSSPGALLIVDDEPAILELVTRVCEVAGYRCLQALNGSDALNIFQRDRASIAGVITDVNMPGIHGFALIRAIRELAPEMRFIISSGSLSDPEQQIVTTIPNSAFLPKPYTPAQLVECIRSVLRR
jgi:DNA-binding response OmpR family regulator